jgi:DNA-binding CsgD family transcriptional regulator
MGLLGALVVFVLVGTERLKALDPAIDILRIPFIPAILYTVWELTYLIFSLTGMTEPIVLAILAAVSRMTWLSMGFASLVFCYRHYAVNGIPLTGLIPMRALVAATGFNYLVYFAGFFVKDAEFAIRGFNTLVLAASFLYAGLTAIFAANKKKEFYPSSWGGFYIAFFSLPYVPFVGIADAFYMKLFFFQDNRSLSIQLNPFFLFLVTLVVIYFIFRLRSAKPGELFSSERPLSNREREIAALLEKKYSNKEIAQELNISLPTVKTHVSNILAKRGAKSRSSLVSPESGEETL